jgi:hypothetical protein
MLKNDKEIAKQNMKLPRPFMLGTSSSTFFSLYVFGIFIIFPSVAPHRGQPSAKCHAGFEPGTGSTG